MITEAPSAAPERQTELPSTDANPNLVGESHSEKDLSIDWMRCSPFIAMHLAVLAVFFVGWSWPALALACVLYFVRMFGLTGFYHRYFSHHAFKTSRAFQFIGACMGAAAVQRGPIWWAAHHRDHHRFSDTEEDTHSPHAHGFWFSHMGWFMTKANYATKKALVKDWMRFPELRFINRFDLVVPVLLAVFCIGFGMLWKYWFPASSASGGQFFIWGFVISTVALYHSTFAVNSFGHQIGSRPYKTEDHSRNNVIIALLTGGEGWHNNHHHYPVSARNGFRWWQIDTTYYVLKCLSWFRIVWDLHPVPESVRVSRSRRSSSVG